MLTQLKEKENINTHIHTLTQTLACMHKQSYKNIQRNAETLQIGNRKRENKRVIRGDKSTQNIVFVVVILKL